MFNRFAALRFVDGHCLELGTVEENLQTFTGEDETGAKKGNTRDGAGGDTFSMCSRFSSRAARAWANDDCAAACIADMALVASATMTPASITS